MLVSMFVEGMGTEEWKRYWEQRDCLGFRVYGQGDLVSGIRLGLRSTASPVKFCFWPCATVTLAWGRNPKP